MLPFFTRCCARAPQLSRSNLTRSFTSTIPKPTAAPRIPPRSPNQSQRVIGQGQDPRIQSLASKILEAGNNELYRNTVSTGYVGTALSIMVTSYVSIGYLYSTRLWESGVAKARGLHWGVPIAYQVTMISWGLLAAYAFSRTLGIVKSIKLIRTVEGILLETSIRRPVPFMKPEIFVSEPSTLMINKAKLYGAADPTGMITASQGTSFISRLTRTLFYAPFHNTRKSLGGVGLVPIKVGPSGGQRNLMLDVDGQFSNGGQDLVSIAQDDF